MSTSSSANRRQFWRRDWFVPAVLSVPPATGGTAAPSAILAAAEPGYDSGLQLQAGQVNLFAKSAIFSWPAGSGAPSGGDGETDPEAATPGHL